jgi:hypothetical protein
MTVHLEQIYADLDKYREELAKLEKQSILFQGAIQALESLIANQSEDRG